MKLHRYSLPLLAVCAVALSACGDDDDNDPVRQDPQTERPQPQSADPLWKGVLFEHEVESNSPDGCISPKRMVFMNDGTFIAGPCTRDGSQTDSPTNGTLTADEQTELNRVMNLMIEAENRSRRECQEIGVLNESEIKVTLNNNRTYTPFEENERSGRCYRGPIENVDEVRAYIVSLEQKYYPTGTPPSPSPSPSASPSPSPSPSASPSPSPSASPSPSPSASPSPTVTVSPIPALLSQ